MSAVAHAAFGNTVFHSANAKLVVSTIDRRSYRRLTIWKSRSAARLSYDRYPISSSYVELHINRLMLSAS